jgi:hypothetical protein
MCKGSSDRDRSGGQASPSVSPDDELGEELVRQRVKVVPVEFALAS